MQHEDSKYECGQKTQLALQGYVGRVKREAESRNYMCANMKRNDPITRHCLQYLCMQSSQILVLIRDAKTSRILRSPPEEQLWLHRHKNSVVEMFTPLTPAQLVSVGHDQWNVNSKVGQSFFEKSRFPFV